MARKLKKLTLTDDVHGTCFRNRTRQHSSSALIDVITFIRNLKAIWRPGYNIYLQEAVMVGEKSFFFFSRLHFFEIQNTISSFPCFTILITTNPRNQFGPILGHDYVVTRCKSSLWFRSVWQNSNWYINIPLEIFFPLKGIYLT